MQSSKKSETDTTANNDLCKSFDSAISLLKLIAEKLPEKEKEFDPVQYLSRSLKSSDVLLEYKVVAHTKEGEVFNVEGVNNLSRLLDDSMLPEAPGNFEQAFNVCIMRPVFNAFMKHIRDIVEEQKKSSSAASATLQDTSISNYKETNFLSDE